MTVISEETTTLPEGAKINVAIIEKARADKSLARIVQLRAYNEAGEVVMKCDDVAAYNLRHYLEMIVREIHRQRDKLAAAMKPGIAVIPVRQPKTLEECVRNMMSANMFILNVTATVAAANKPDKKPRRRKPDKKDKVPTNGNKPF